jgi:uncharacterized protein (DUF885 family)
MVNEQLNQIFNDEWERRLVFDPLLATYIGDHRYDDCLPRLSEEHFENRIHELEGYLLRLDAVDASEFTNTDRLNADIFRRLISDEAQLFKYRAYRMPLAKVSSFFTYFPDIRWQMVFDKEDDYDRYIKRLRAFPQLVEDYIDLMKAGLRFGQIPPRVILDGVGEAISTQIVDKPENSLLYEPFLKMPPAIPDAVRNKLIHHGMDAILRDVNEGYQKLLSFFDEEYYPASRPLIAAYNLPDGEAYYQHCIRYYTSLEISPEAIHKIGLEEVERIRTEMQAVMHAVGFKGSFHEFIEFLRVDPQFYVDTPQKLLEKTALVLKKMDGELPRLFTQLPRLPYGIREIPGFAAPGATSAYYSPGAGDGSRAGYYYVNTYDLASRPLYEIEALSFHEAVPGHHLQLAFQQELDLPDFRRFFGITAFVEGWALYAEKLGLDVGFYTDPYSNFGRLSYEMWRACRLVVDTGMHALGWSRQQAIDFMADNTSSTLLNIENEVDRYIAWPGQALAYKLGELKIMALRRKAEHGMGDSFDLRKFHLAILREGAVPLSTLERMVDDFIQKGE